ncbi:MAG TPA: DUF4253 domain-containing protein [Chitinophagaceae bacterium]|nr:DUF4253 domain-containing protein [Chitinophagaceae bacterium]
MDRSGFFKQAFSLLKKAAVPPKEVPEEKPAALPAEVTDPSALTSIEIGYCNKAGLHPDTGIFLKKLTKRPIEKLVFEDYDTETNKPSGICSFCPEEEARAIICQYQQEFISKGQFLYISDIPGNGLQVAILNGITDPYLIMQLTETNGANHELMTADIIEQLKKWDASFGVRITGIGFDFCECAIVNKEIDYNKLAAEIYQFCPDVVDQGTETLEALEDELRRTGSIFLWWD